MPFVNLCLWNTNEMTTVQTMLEIAHLVLLEI